MLIRFFFRKNLTMVKKYLFIIPSIYANVKNKLTKVEKKLTKVKKIFPVSTKKLFII